MPEHTLTLLHISDLHDRGPREEEPGSRARVLGDAWTTNLAEIRAEGPVDLVCFTGDAACSGKADEYARVKKFFQSMLDRLGLGWDRFFLIPGNHDIDQDIAKPVWRRMRAKLPRANRSDVGRWLASGRAPLGFNNREKEQVFRRSAAYREWVKESLRLPHLDPAFSPHGHLGYRKTLHLPGHPFDLHVLGLDSAWLCGDKNDAGKLLLTAAQVMRLAATANGRPLEGFRLCLVHHPLDELADGNEARQLLAERVDFLLHGHLHEPGLQTWADPDRTLRGVAAGCLYEHDRYPNACERIRLTLDDLGRPLRYEIWFRGWSTDGFWFDDNSRYRGTKDGRLVVHVVAASEEPAEDPRVARVMVDREPELVQLVESLLGDGETRPITCAVQGMAGVGKSYLANRFVYLYKARFPGGVYRLLLDPENEPAPTAESLLGKLADRLRLSLAPAGLADRIRARLRKPRSLLQVENVDGEALAGAVAGLIGALPGCPALVTGRFRGLGETVGWRQVMVPSFNEATALEQLEAEMGEKVVREKEEAYQRLVQTLGFLPLAVHLVAGHLRNGRTVKGVLNLLRKTRWKLRPADLPDPPLLTQGENRVLLASTFSLSMDLLLAQLGAEGKRLLAGFVDLGHAPSSGFSASLGAAIAGLQDPLDFEELTFAACRLSLLDSIPASERGDRAFRLHPLLAELLRDQGERKGRPRALERMTEWFASRVPILSSLPEQEKGKRWKEVLIEFKSLSAPLLQIPDGDGEKVTPDGPEAPWVNRLAPQGRNRDRATAVPREQTDLERVAEEERKTAVALGWIADLVESFGSSEKALSIRREAELPAFERLGDEWSCAVTRGKVADVLQRQGDLDGALRIRYEQELPVYERLGDVQLRAATMSKIADVRQTQGDLEEALLIYEEQLQIFRDLGDVRSWAVTMGRIAVVRHEQGNLEEALRIYEEQLQVFSQLGDVRERAVTMGRIADVRQEQRNLEEALRIRFEEELPVYEQLGDLREYAVTMGKIAEVREKQGKLDEAIHIRREEELSVYEQFDLAGELLIGRMKLAQVLLKRNQAGDRECAAELLHQALRAAEQMKLPEAEKIRKLLRKEGLAPAPKRS
jgi:tetratricopeptide (TPR) repeat protein/predicted MPP superfamily phosphohydrolase